MKNSDSGCTNVFENDYHISLQPSGINDRYSNQKKKSSVYCSIDTMKRCSSMISTAGRQVYMLNKQAQAVNKKRRTERDHEKNWPKRPLSPYNIFINAERAKLILEHKMNNIVNLQSKMKGNHEGIHTRYIRKGIVFKWKHMSVDEKSAYKRLAADSMDAYRAKVKMFLKTGSWDSKSRSANYPVDT